MKKILQFGVTQQFFICNIQCCRSGDAVATLGKFFRQVIRFGKIGICTLDRKMTSFRPFENITAL